MRLLTFVFIGLSSFSAAFGQKTEVTISLNSGLFRFVGTSAESDSQINYSEETNSGYTNNPYGSKFGLCSGVSMMAKEIHKSGILYGVELGVDLLRSKIGLDGVYSSSRSGSTRYTATGETYLAYLFLNAHPFLGYRVKLKNVSFDLTGGLDLAYCLSTTESGIATADNQRSYTTSRDRKTISFDGRYRVQVAANYNRLGLSVGYAESPLNYKSGYVGGVNECFARLIRFGVSYRIIN